MNIAPTSLDVLQFLAEHGEQTTLVTLVAVTGSASRAVCTQMAVAADGRSCGSFSGGCIDEAIIAEAREALMSGQGRIVRFGAGSPYLDVRLPCGGAIDLLFTPNPAQAIVRAALAALTARKPFAVSIAESGICAADTSGFELTYYPPLRVMVVGQGDDLSALVRLADSLGSEVFAIAPAEQIAKLCLPASAKVIPAPSRYTMPAVQTDPWTAIVFLFHDRDWEEFLLPQALALDAFYHGAIGSPRTHAVRRQTLVASGIEPAHIGRLRETVGLIPSTRDPATLALSILAELVQDYQALVAQPRPIESE